MDKVKLYKEVFALFIKVQVPDTLIVAYLNEEDDSVINLQNYIGSFKSIDWISPLSVIDAADLIIESAFANSNLKR